MNSSNYMEYRDLQYEQTNLVFNESDSEDLEGEIKCKNYELCKHTLPLEHYEHHANYLCMTCGDWFKVGGFGWNELEFRESDEECSVCFEKNKKQLKFPTNCGHYFCVDCSRNILFWDETRYHLSPIPFGCPHCPNNCENPIKGSQCGCDEYSEIKDKWEQDFPLEFEKWNESFNFSIDLGETEPGSIFNSCKCPICKTKYKRNK